MTHRIYIWFADNGNIRKWSREPFEEGTAYVAGPTDADDYIDQLNALCEDFGCEPGSDRLHWLHEQLSRRALPLPADLEEWEKLAEGVTPGEWRSVPLGGSSTVLTPSMPPRNDRRSEVTYGYMDGGEYCIAFPFLYQAEAGKSDERTRMDFVCFGHRDARWIAACSPDRILSLVRELAEARKAREWRTIDSAPKDGTRFLATDGKEIFRTQGSYGAIWVPNGKGGHMPDPQRRSFCWLASEFSSLTPWNPTHWMPLPAAPSAEAETQETPDVR